MTAWNIIVQPDAAYLLTDTAIYNLSEQIIGFTPKVVQAVGRLPCAFALAGHCLPHDLLTELGTISLDTPRDLVASLPDIVRKLERAAGPSSGTESPIVAIAAAVYCPDQRRALGLVISNDDSLFGESSGYPVYSVQGVGFHAVFDRVALFGRADIDLSDPAQFDPVEDGGRVLDRQREGLDWCGGGRVVGGQGVLTRVTADGVDHCRLRLWPDRVGEKIAA